MLAEQFDCVTIFYGEIIGFTALISDCSASEVCLVLAWPLRSAVLGFFVSGSFVAFVLGLVRLFVSFCV